MIRFVLVRLTYAAIAFGLATIVRLGLPKIAAAKASFAADPVCRRTIDMHTPSATGPFCTILPGTVVRKYRHGKYGTSESLVVDDARGDRFDFDLSDDWLSRTYDEARPDEAVVLELERNAKNGNWYPGLIATPAGQSSLPADPWGADAVEPFLGVAAVAFVVLAVRPRGRPEPVASSRP